MRMAKLQKATLDPSKISGHCGRLKCCLLYEDKTYMDLKDNLPKRNAMIQTPNGPGKVVDMHILTQLVVVQDQLGDRKAWPVDELCPVGEKLPPKKSQPELEPLNDLPDEAITAELEDLAQTEQEMVSAPGKKPGNNRNRSQRPKKNGSGNQQASSNQKQRQEQSGENKNRRGGRNRRRRSKNKNRNTNNQNNQQGGNNQNKPKPSGGNQSQ